MSSDNNERVSSQVMELKDLIAGPLTAAIDADSLSAQRCLDYLCRIAFESYDPKTGKTGAVRMLTFSYLGRDLYGTHRQTVCIPLLTLVPLPLLQIQEADFDFDIQVIDASIRRRQPSFSFETGRSEVQEESTASETRLRVTLPACGGRADSSESGKDDRNANMKIHVRMRQADLPGGLSVLLNKAVNNMVDEVGREEQPVHEQ